HVTGLAASAFAPADARRAAARALPPGTAHHQSAAVTPADRARAAAAILPALPALSRPRLPSRHPMSSAVKPCSCSACFPACAGARQRQGSPAGGLAAGLDSGCALALWAAAGGAGPGMEQGSGGGGLGLAV